MAAPSAEYQSRPGSYLGKLRGRSPDRSSSERAVYLCIAMAARLVKKEALAAGVRGNLSEAERGQLFAGHSLRAGLASSTETTKNRTIPSFQDVSDKSEIHEMPRLRSARIQGPEVLEFRHHSRYR
jgi:hypothetical protein